MELWNLGMTMDRESTYREKIKSTLDRDEDATHE